MFITSFQLELLLRIFLAALCGLCIGYERMNHYKAAGVKNHMIVGLSSALIMIVSKYGFPDVPEYDAARVAAQVVSGVGFIGAGIIFRKNMSIQGLTTAAGIWATAGTGLALGSGMYFIGMVGTALYIVLCIVVQNIEKFQNGIQVTYSIYITNKSMNEALGICKNIKIVAYSIEVIDEKNIKMDVSLLFENHLQKMSWEKSALSAEDVYRFEQY